MRLTDIMSHMDLSVYPQIGLIIFLIVFAAVVIRVVFSKRSDTDRLASMPLADDVAGSSSVQTKPSAVKEQSHGA